MAYLLLRAHFDPEAAPAPEDASPPTLAVLLGVGAAILPPLGLIFAVLGSIFFGIATPTEAAGVGAAGALLLAAAYGRLNVPVLKDVLWETSRTTAFIFAIFLGATAYSLVLRGLGGTRSSIGRCWACPLARTASSSRSCWPPLSWASSSTGSKSL